MLQVRHLRRRQLALAPARIVPHFRLSSSSSSAAPPSVPIEPADSTEPSRKSFYLYYNLLFPLRTSLLDVRYLLTRFQRPQLLASLSKQLEPLDKRYEGVKVEEIETREKDGGAFVRISWDQERSRENELGEDRVRHLVEDEAQLALAKSSFRPWFNVLNQTPKAFLVKGRPWMEDMNRFPSRELIIEFEGPEVSLPSTWRRSMYHSSHEQLVRSRKRDCTSCSDLTARFTTSSRPRQSPPRSSLRRSDPPPRLATVSTPA